MMSRNSFYARAAVGVLTVLAGWVAWQGLPAAAGPRACYMTDSEGNRADFHLTDQPHSIVIDLGKGAVYTFPKTPGLQEGGMHVGAVGEPGKGSVSVLVDKDGKFQQTLLMPGEQPVFYYGECAR